MKKKNIKDLFDRMDDWRHLPKYQLERRADLFFALYLKDVLEIKGFDIEDKIIPEFPVRKALILGEDHQHKNYSYNIDYVAISRDGKKAILIELKTDLGSKRKKQDDYLTIAVNVGLNRLLEETLKICEATKAKEKYYNLLKLLESLGLITGLEEKKNMIANYKAAINNIRVTNNIEETLLFYIQPSCEKSININFKDYIDVLEDYDDCISKSFKASLKKWANK